MPQKKKYAIGGSYQGGPIGKHQWELPSSPNTPGYESYGNTYYVPGGYGLYEKPRDYSKEYAGYGNPANLLSNQVYTPMNRPKAVNPYNTQDIMKKKAMRQMDTTGRYNNMYLQGEGSTSDYSIDALRQNTMAYGGYAPKRGYFFNGRTMQKAKEGAYDTMWREGGQFQQVPVHQDMYRYGINLYKDGGMVDVPVPQHMGRYGLMLYKGGGSVPPSYTAFQPNLNGMYKEGGIHIKPENKGKFTQWAKSHGMGVQEAARHVMANKEDYSSTIVKRANFAANAKKWHHQYGGPTMQNGGYVKGQEYDLSENEIKRLESMGYKLKY